MWKISFTFNFVLKNRFFKFLDTYDRNILDLFIFVAKSHVSNQFSKNKLYRRGIQFLIY